MNADNKNANQAQKIIIIGLCLLIISALAISIFQLTINKENTTSNTTFGMGAVQASARDTERQTDIKSIHAQIEAYWAQIGYYPSLDELNDPSFVSENLKGLDTEALRDPQGSGETYASIPGKNIYSYEVLPKNCDNSTTQCTSYTLTATLEKESNGSMTYTKTSLNAPY